MSFAFFELTEPPYNIDTFSEFFPTYFFNKERIFKWIFSISFAVGVNPVPMAQTGS